jgi:EpsG family
MLEIQRDILSLEIVKARPCNLHPLNLRKHFNLIAYYSLICLPFIILFRVRKQRAVIANGFWLTFFFFFIFVIGFRDNVGADWNAYIRHYELTQGISLIEAIQTTDPGYAFINWISALVSGGIYLVNVICSAFVLIFLILFSRKEQTPWFFVSISILFYIIIIGMSLSRQAVAIGFELMAIRAVLEKNHKYYIFCIMFAALFHKTALILFPLYAIVHSEKTFTLIASILFFIALSALLITLEIFTSFYYYIEGGMESEGALFRSLYLSIPGLLFLIYRKRLQLSKIESKAITTLAVLSVATLSINFSALTAADRLMLYLMPLPPIVYCRLILLFKTRINILLYQFITISTHIFLLFIWLNYSNNSIAWIPYENVLLK